MQLTNLDAETRLRMRLEVDQDILDGTIYKSPRLSARGLADYEELLRDAVDRGTPQTFAAALASMGRLNDRELSTYKGTPITKDVPRNANETLAEGEFNRYYARGLCRRLVEDGGGQVEVYRAKEVAKPRSQSQVLIGQRVDAADLLADLRSSQGVEPALGLPPGPNSGLSVQLPSA